jgi:U3 small nucleolar RNA-associated protein 13
VSGGSDATIILWKDDTSELLEKKTTEINERVEKEQLLANLLFDRKYLKALGLALSLEHPLKALMVIRGEGISRRKLSQKIELLTSTTFPSLSF